MSYLPQPPSLLAGNRLFTDLSNLIILHSRCAANGGRSGFRNATNSTASYAVTGGKTFTASVLRVDTGAAAFGQNANSNCLFYADTDTGFDGADPTSPKPYGGTSETASIPFFVPANTTKFFDLKFAIPAGKFIYLFYGDNFSAAGNFCSLTLYGYET
jgi:hypothetical protein